MHYHLVPNDHPALHRVSSPVPPDEVGSKHIQTLLADMKAILASQELGVAIAAPQVGESLRIFIVSGKALIKPAEENSGVSTDLPDDLVCINPELTRLSRKRQDLHEGCLSLPGWWGVVPRAERTTITALDEHGVPFTRGASGLLAHIFQHELDHLEGILYSEKAIKMMRDDSFTIDPHEA